MVSSRPQRRNWRQGRKGERGTIDRELGRAKTKGRGGDERRVGVRVGVGEVGGR